MVVNYIRERDAVIRPESLCQETKVIQSGLNMTQITFFLDVESAKHIIAEHVVQANVAGNNSIPYEHQNYGVRPTIMN